MAILEWGGRTRQRILIANSVRPIGSPIGMR